MDFGKELKYGFASSAIGHSADEDQNPYYISSLLTVDSQGYCMFSQSLMADFQAILVTLTTADMEVHIWQPPDGPGHLER